MKHFITGFLITIAIIFLIKTYFQHETNNEKFDKEMPIIEQSKRISVKPIHKQKIIPVNNGNKPPISTQSEEISNNPSEPPSVKSNSELRQQLYNLVMGVEDENLQQSIDTFKHSSASRANEIYESEERNEDLAIARENSLESSFYEKLPYKGNAKINSIECRTTLCKVELELPGSADFSPMPLVRWDSGLRQTRMDPKQSKAERKTMWAFFTIEDIELIPPSNFEETKNNP